MRFGQDRIFKYTAYVALKQGIFERRVNFPSKKKGEGAKRIRTCFCGKVGWDDGRLLRGSFHFCEKLRILQAFEKPPC